MRRMTYATVILMVVIITLAWGCTTVTPPKPNLEAGGTPDTSEVEAEDEVPKNALKWTTASEVENFGFDIFRSQTEDGSRSSELSSVASGAGTNDEPKTYIWEDFDM